MVAAEPSSGVASGGVLGASASVVLGGGGGADGAQDIEAEAAEVASEYVLRGESGQCGK